MRFPTSATDLLMLLALAFLCLGVRWAGFIAAARSQLPPKLRRLIESVPAPLLAALLASSAVHEGAAGVVAVAIAIPLMILMRNEIVAAAAGVTAAFLFSAL